MGEVHFEQFNEEYLYEDEKTDSNEDITVKPEGQTTDIKLSSASYKLGVIGRSFPFRKQKDGFPVATEKAYMADRRPLWLPKFGLDVSYFKHASYFSEVISREQYSRQMLIDLLFKPKYGQYKFCKTNLIKKQFISEYLDGVSSCKFSPNGKYLVLGCGNGSIEVLRLFMHYVAQYGNRGGNNRLSLSNSSFRLTGYLFKNS